MSPHEIAVSLRRVAELADMTLQSQGTFSEVDDTHLKKIEAVIDVLYQRNEAAPVQSDRRRRPVVLDSPEYVAAVDEIVEAASELREVNCGTCHDTHRVMRRDRHGDWVQTTTPCPECSPPAVDVTGVTTPMQALGQAMRQLGLSSDIPPLSVASLDDVERNTPPARLLYRSQYITAGDVLTAEQRNFVRAIAQNGPDVSRLAARDILDAEPALASRDPEETWSFGMIVVRIGSPLTAGQTASLMLIANNRSNAWSIEQQEKARRFLAAAPVP